jgi:hypothetical protein
MTGAGPAAVGSILVQRDAAWDRAATPDDVLAAHKVGELRELIAARNSPDSMPMFPTPQVRQESRSCVDPARADLLEADRHPGELDSSGVVRIEKENI